MTTVCIVQARMTSTRLPGKVMLSLGGEPAIRHVLRRCQAIPGVDRVVCAVPDDPRSKPIECEAIALGVTVVAGSEHDVLGRYWKAAHIVLDRDHKDTNRIMRVTGDCPLIDPGVCGRVLGLMDEGVEYASNVFPRRGFPQGLDCQVFTIKALDRAYEEATDPADREDVCPWMQRNLFCAILEGDGDPELRWCLDTLDDYVFLSEKMETHRHRKAAWEDYVAKLSEASIG